MADYIFRINDDEKLTPEVEDFVFICKKCAELYAKKNDDYGNSFDKGMKEIGPAYGVGRLYDKVNRIINLTKNPESQKVKNESIEDNLMDLACYSIMCLAYNNRVKKETFNDIDL